MARGRRDYEKAVISVEAEGFVNPHGRILMHDDFEDTPLKWTTMGTGTWFVSRQARAAYNGSYGLELDVTAAGLPLGGSAIAYRYIPIDLTERLLLEIFWRTNVMTRLQYFSAYIRFYDGDYYHNASLRFDRGLGQWTYYDAAGAWIQIPSTAQTFYNDAWNELTIAVDFMTNEYITSKSNNIEVNMNGLGCWNPMSGVGAHAEIWLAAHTDIANQLLVSIDDVVVRELEV